MAYLIFNRAISYKILLIFSYGSNNFFPVSWNNLSIFLCIMAIMLEFSGPRSTEGMVKWLRFAWPVDCDGCAWGDPRIEHGWSREEEDRNWNTPMCHSNYGRSANSSVSQSCERFFRWAWIWVWVSSAAEDRREMDFLSVGLRCLWLPSLAIEAR